MHIFLFQKYLSKKLRIFYKTFLNNKVKKYLFLNKNICLRAKNSLWNICLNNIIYIFQKIMPTNMVYS